MMFEHKTWLLAAVLVLVGVLVYAFNLNNELFWDDDDWIINNNFVHSISWDNVKFWFSNDALAGVGLKSNYYRPFLFFTFALNWVVSETKPFLWHLVSNSIHIANAVLIFILLNKLLTTSDIQRTSYVETFGRWIAFLTALIFTIHPLNTEAVTYIAGRGDPLSVFFMLLALYLWAKPVDKRLAKSFIHRLGVFKILSLAALILAILSRETAIIFPFLLMVFYIAFMSKSKLTTSNVPRTLDVKGAFKEALPYFGVVAVYGILRLTVLNFQNTLNFYSDPNIYSENLHVRIFTFLSILWEYLKLLVVPIGLHMERSATVYTSLFQWPVWAVGAVLVLLFYCLIVMYRREQFNNSTFRIWFFGVSWFFIALAPASGITPINALMYEHWLYLPMVGFWLIMSFYLVKLFDYFKSKSLAVCYLLLTILVIYLSFFAYQSIQRNILWGKPIEFYKDILKYEPDSVRINNNLGNLHFNRGDNEQAELYYRKAAESGDAFAQPHFNIGSILQSRGDIDGAIAEFDKAIEIYPNFYYPYQNLAVIYAQQGDFAKAVINMEKLKLLLPANPRVYYNSALVYVALNNREKALADLKEGLKYSSIDHETGRLIEEFIKQLTAE